MYTRNIIETLERTPIIAATDSEGLKRALLSDVEVMFHLNADIMTVKDDIKSAKEHNKYIFNTGLTQGTVLGVDKELII